MEHKNPLLVNKSSHKFITIGEIMLRLTPPNYQKIRMANEFEATTGHFSCFTGSFSCTGSISGFFNHFFRCRWIFL